MQKWQCRVAPSLGGGFAGSAETAWGTVPYTDPYAPTVFFGMYGMQDVQSLYTHIGERAILWAGSDIKNFLNGYWLDAKGEYRAGTSDRIFWGARHFVENHLEQAALRSVGIDSMVVPSFLGDVTKYPLQEIRTDKKRYYTSVSGDDFELYGWGDVHGLARKNPDTEYHLYGNNKTFWVSDEVKNIFVHGRVSQEQMDEETKTMTGALRLTRFDGASEILVKSVLWGQQPLSPYIHYPWLNDRGAFLKVANKYPWNVHAN